MGNTDYYSKINYYVKKYFNYDSVGLRKSFNYIIIIDGGEVKSL